MIGSRSLTWSSRTVAHKTLRRGARRRWHRWYLRYGSLNARERAIIGAIHGHAGHLWWVTGMRGR